MSQEISTSGPELMGPPAESPQMNHGRTIAGWFLFWVASVGALVAGVGVAMWNAVPVIIGAVIMAIGIIGSLVLRAMGYGQPVKKGPAPTVEDL